MMWVQLLCNRLDPVPINQLKLTWETSGKRFAIGSISRRDGNQQLKLIHPPLIFAPANAVDAHPTHRKKLRHHCLDIAKWMKNRKKWLIPLGTLTDDSQRQDAAVLHALAVGTFEGDAAADLQVVVLGGLLVRHGWTASVVGGVLLQDVAGSNHHSSGLGEHMQELLQEDSGWHPIIDLWCLASGHFIRYN